MTGLLHRLAARASGTAWTVRSDARLPFGAGRLREGEAVQEPQEPQEFVAAVPGADAPMAATPPVQQRNRPAEPYIPAISAISATTPHGPPAAMETQPASPPPLLKPVPAKTAPVGALAAAHALQQPFPSDTTSAIGATARPPATAPTSALEPPTVHRPAWSATSENAAPPGHAPHLHGEPAPLLPPVRAHASQPGMPSPRQLAAAWRAPGAPQHPVGQDTEVHIHIGRIDVTAVHEAPRPKARTRERERTQPVSLDAYLATRGAR